MQTLSPFKLFIDLHRARQELQKIAEEEKVVILDGFSFSSKGNNNPDPDNNSDPASMIINSAPGQRYKELLQDLGYTTILTLLATGAAAGALAARYVIRNLGSLTAPKAAEELARKYQRSTVSYQGLSWTGELSKSGKYRIALKPEGEGDNIPSCVIFPVDAVQEVSIPDEGAPEIITKKALVWQRPRALLDEAIPDVIARLIDERAACDLELIDQKGRSSGYAGRLLRLNPAEDADRIHFLVDANLMMDFSIQDIIAIDVSYGETPPYITVVIDERDVRKVSTGGDSRPDWVYRLVRGDSLVETLIEALVRAGSNSASVAEEPASAAEEPAPAAEEPASAAEEPASAASTPEE